MDRKDALKNLIKAGRDLSTEATCTVGHASELNRSSLQTAIDNYAVALRRYEETGLAQLTSDAKPGGGYPATN